jgi:lipoprotein signal peptidase
VLRLTLVVGAADLSTKLLLATPPEVQHPIDVPWLRLALLPLSVLVALAIGRYTDPTGAWLCAAGALCNGVDSLDGVAQNPFVVFPNADTAAGFNAADVAIVVGVVLMLTEPVKVLARQSEKEG